MLKSLNKVPVAMTLVMMALEGNDFSVNDLILREKKESPLFMNRSVCIFLLESLFLVIGNDDSNNVPSTTTNLSQKITKGWRHASIIKVNVASASMLDMSKLSCNKIQIVLFLTQKHKEQ